MNARYWKVDAQKISNSKNRYWKNTKKQKKLKNLKFFYVSIWSDFETT